MVRVLVVLVVVAGCGFSRKLGGAAGDDAPIDAPEDVIPDVPASEPPCAKLALGSDHSCALRDGAVYCWGSNAFGSTGGGSTTLAVTLPATVQLASAKYHACAVAMDGTVRCWGYNDGGQLGVGVTGGQSNAPMLVSGMTGAVQVQTGRTQSCARRANGTVRCWGANTSGQLGDGTFTPQNTAVADVMNVTGAVDLNTTSSHVCVRNAAGAALCWGDNGYSQLGDSTTTDHNTPIAAPVTGVSWIGTASFSSDITGGHTCSIVNGMVECWGDNAVGQLGNGTTDDALSPVIASGITDAVQVVMGRWHVCARHASGHVSCWGRNFDGEVGNNSQAVRNTPFDVGLTDVLDIGAGGFHTCAITKSKELYCWGLNSSGQLGIAGNVRYLVPTKSFTLCP